MAHVDLTASSSTALAALGSRRTYTVVGGDNTTVLVFYVADSAAQSSGPPLIDGRDNRRNALQLRVNQSATFDDSSGFVGYTLTGTAPTAVMVDGPGAGTAAVTVATTGAAGAVLLTSAPGSATAPTAVSSTDPRVSVIEALVQLSASDGSLVEVPLPSPNVACTITAVTLEVPTGTYTKSDTNYITVVVAKRDGAGSSATPIATATSKVTGGIQLVAFTDVSMGALAGAGAPTLLATDRLTLASTKTSSGLAVGWTKVRISFTPTV